MEVGHDHLGRGNALLIVDIRGNAAAVVAHRHRAVGAERDVDAVAVTGERLVDGVVHDLEDHVVEARAILGIADVHARALAHRLEPTQDLDGLGAVVLVERRRRGCVFAHSSSPQARPSPTLANWARPSRPAKTLRSVPVSQA